MQETQRAPKRKIWERKWTFIWVIAIICIVIAVVFRGRFSAGALSFDLRKSHGDVYNTINKTILPHTKKPNLDLDLRARCSPCFRRDSIGPILDFYIKNEGDGEAYNVTEKVLIFKIENGRVQEYADAGTAFQKGFKWSPGRTMCGAVSFTNKDRSNYLLLIHIDYTDENGKEMMPYHAVFELTNEFGTTLKLANDKHSESIDIAIERYQLFADHAKFGTR